MRLHWLRLCVAPYLMVMVFAAVLWPHARAEACWFRPGCLRDPLPVAGETLPANFAFVSLQRCLGASDIQFTAERDGKGRSVEFEQRQAEGELTLSDVHRRTGPLGFDVLKIRSPLEPGETLVLRYAMETEADAGAREEVEVRWPIGEERQLPTDLGKLEVRQHQEVIRVAANSSCLRYMMSSYADVSLERSEAVKPWLPLLRYELRIDDNTWIYYDALGASQDRGSWYSSLGPGNDRVVLGCEVDPHRPVINEQHIDPQAIEPGPHRVRMLGFLPTGEALSSEEIVVDMQCGPDTARSLKAQLDACAEEKTESKTSSLAAVSGDGGSCSATAPGNAKSTGAFAWLLLSVCVCRLRWSGRRAPGVARAGRALHD